MRVLYILCYLISAALLSQIAVAKNPEQIAALAASEVESLIPLYQHFHQNPELSLQEEKTSERLATELQSAGFEVTTKVGGFGVVSVLKNGDGPIVMFRSDMDALPIREETGLPYASTVVAKTPEGDEAGVMHACGHDFHMTNLVGLARFLSKHKDLWTGTVVLIGQPAEEIVKGARSMLDDGLLTRFPKPQFALAIHCDSTLPSGVMGLRSGYLLASSDSCTITLRGRGGHGSAPEICIDPIVQAAQLTLDLQTIVSREISTFEQAVVTVGAIHGGTKHNIIPDECKLLLSIRSYSPKFAVTPLRSESNLRKRFNAKQKLLPSRIGRHHLRSSSSHRPRQRRTMKSSSIAYSRQWRMRWEKDESFLHLPRWRLRISVFMGRLEFHRA